MNADIYVVTEYFKDWDLWPEPILVTLDGEAAQALTLAHPHTDDTDSHYVLTRWSGGQEVSAHLFTNGKWDGHGELR